MACGTEGDYACRLLRLPPKHTSLAHSYAVNTTVPACTYHITTHAARAHHHKPQIDGVDCLCLLNLLSIQPCSAASHKCDSRVRHFGGVVAFPVVNGAPINSHRAQELGCASLSTVWARGAPVRAAHSCTARVRAPSVWMPTSSSSSATVSLELVRCHARTLLPLRCAGLHLYLQPAHCATACEFELTGLAPQPRLLSVILEYAILQGSLLSRTILWCCLPLDREVSACMWPHVLSRLGQGQSA